MRTAADMEEATAQLSDVAFRLKAAIEDKNIAAVGGLFVPRANVCVGGRFMTVKELQDRLAKRFATIEEVAVDITRLSEHEIHGRQGFASFDVDLTWLEVDRWEEQTSHGTVSLTLERAAERQAAGKQAAEKQRQRQQDTDWKITGFSYFAAPRNAAGDDRPDVGTSSLGLGGFDPTRGPYSFWM